MKCASILSDPMRKILLMPSSGTEDAQKNSGETPASASNVSPTPSADQKDSSVLDFLYHDVRRVGSFLSQFQEYGFRQQTSATESSGRTQSNKTGWTTGMSGFGIARVGGVEEVTTGTEEKQQAQHSYDPLWRNALTFLDYLTEREMLQRDLWNARLGQFVLVAGTLVVLDPVMLRTAYEKPSIKRVIKTAAQPVAANRHARRAQRHNQPDTTPNDMDFAIELLSLMPHSIQAHLFAEKWTVWCGLSEQSLIGVSSDLVLKHGSFVPGEWQMLGILDAQPDLLPQAAEGEAATQSLDDLVAGMMGTAVGELAAKIAPLARTMLGRPRNAFGVTPLLIFRRVSG